MMEGQISLKPNAVEVNICPSYRKDQMVKGVKFLLDDFSEVADIRVYSPNFNTYYCCLWIWTPRTQSKSGEVYHSSGRAAGYGYDKESECVADALRKLFSLEGCDPGGCGYESAIRIAEKAIRTLLPDNMNIHTVRYHA